MVESNHKKSELEQQFWRNVRITMDSKNLSLAKLARMAGLSPATLSSAYYKAIRTRLSCILRVSKALEIAPEKLLYGHHNPNQPREEVNVKMEE